MPYDDKYIKVIDFFLGANSYKGFNSYFGQLENTNNKALFLIKGSAGNGKSSLLNKIAENAQNIDLYEKIHCSSDINSLDGIIFPQKKVALVDATRPHFIEPHFAGAFEKVIDLYGSIDEDISQYKDSIIDVSTKISNLHNNCCEYLKNNKVLLDINYNLLKDYVNYYKLDSFISAFSNKYMKINKNKRLVNPTENIRLLSAITNDGYVCYEDTVKSLTSNIIFIDDEIGCISNYILREIKNILLKNGISIYTCYCPIFLDEKIDHIIIKDLNLSILTRNSRTNFLTIKPTKIINAKRFYKTKISKEQNSIISFNRKQSLIYMKKASLYISEAKILHDTLEKYYTPFINFEKINDITKTLIYTINKNLS